MTTSDDFPGSTSSSSGEKENQKQSAAQLDRQQEENGVNSSSRKESSALKPIQEEKRLDRQEEENRVNSSSREESSPLKPIQEEKRSREEKRSGGDSSSRELKLPLGYWFHPSDIELIMNYLIPKILGRNLPAANIIQDFDLYTYEPDLLFVSEFSYIKKHQTYFFAKQSFPRGAGITSKRVTNKGCWKASGEDVPVYNRSNQLVGYKKVLIYYRGREPQEEKTRWTLYEYRVSPKMVMNGIAVADGKYVVCRIKYKDATKKENEQSEKSDHSSSSSDGEENEFIDESQRLTLNDIIESASEEKVKPRDGQGHSNDED
ncbi:hypothetical protein LguiA_021398 [Lonicera macranthoides]